VVSSSPFKDAFTLLTRHQHFNYLIIDLKIVVQVHWNMNLWIWTEHESYEYESSKHAYLSV